MLLYPCDFADDLLHKVRFAIRRLALAKLALGVVNYACIPDVFSGLVYSCDVEPRMTVIFVVLEELMAAASACAIVMLIVTGASAMGATLVPI